MGGRSVPPACPLPRCRDRTAVPALVPTVNGMLQHRRTHDYWHRGGVAEGLAGRVERSGMRPHGRAIAITGASSGIGRGDRVDRAEAGVAVAVGARRADRIEAEAGGRGAVASPPRSRRHPRRGEARGFVETGDEQLAESTALATTRGVMLLGPVTGAETNERRQMIEVDCLGLLYCTHAALPVMGEMGARAHRQRECRRRAPAWSSGRRRGEHDQVGRDRVHRGAAAGGAARERAGDDRRAGLRGDRVAQGQPPIGEGRDAEGQGPDGAGARVRGHRRRDPSTSSPRPLT